jgi:serine/threonine-protein kinase
VSNLLVKELKRSNYRLLGLVGQGQFGQVYCASHRKTGRLVALKELNKQRFPTHKFLRELRFLLSLQHPNIVTCQALEHTLSGRYLVMDYCEGGTLRSLMERGRLHPVQALNLIVNVLEGVEHAHQRGIIHCDIKPENILLTLQPDGWTARITDFGIARLSQELVKGGTGNTGSPAYMAPERFYGQHSVSSDLYAIGILLFELLVGYRPFVGSPAMLMSAHLNQPIQLPESIPAVLHPILVTALQKLSARRFRTATDMLNAVRFAIQSLGSSLSQGWADHTFLRSLPELPSCQYHAVHQESVQTEIRRLVGSHRFAGLNPPGTANTDSQTSDLSDRVYRAFERYVGCQVYPNGLLTIGDRASDATGSSCVDATSPPLVTAQFSELVQDILLRPQGCFVVTARSVYLIPLTLFQAGMTQAEQGCWQQARDPCPVQPHSLPQLVTEFQDDFVVTIEPHGHWMATATLEPSRNGVLTIWRLPGIPLEKFSLPPQLVANVARQPSYLFQLLALGAHHLAAFSHLVDQQTNACITGVLLEIFTRRGDLISSLNIPVPLRSICSSPASCSFIAREPGYDRSLLLVDLKPLRMSRIGLDIVPTLITVASWGYVVISQAGQIVLLNQYGEGLGRIDGPEHPTAIAILEPYTLLISTWNARQGSLYIINLQQLELDIVF